jgi:hypothetical protein
MKPFLILSGVVRNREDEQGWQILEIFPNIDLDVAEFRVLWTTYTFETPMKSTTLKRIPKA